MASNCADWNSSGGDAFTLHLSPERKDSIGAPDATDCNWKASTANITWSRLCPGFVCKEKTALNDGPILEQIAPTLAYRNLFADKAYEYLSRQTSLRFTVFTPIQQAPGQAHLDSADRLFLVAVSRVCQPIEALFHWIHEKTGIEAASQVRSSRGLLVYVFGRLAAAMFLLNRRPDSP